MAKKLLKFSGAFQENSLLVHIMIEIFSIVFAVLLALAVNQWRENRASRVLAHDALHKIAQEMHKNSALIESILPIHQTFLDTVQVVIDKIDRGELPPDADLEDLQFIPIFLRDTAWQAAIATQALVHVDYEIVNVISEAYTYQDAYQKLMDDFLQATFSIDYHAKERSRAQLDAAYSAAQVFLRLGTEMPKLYSRALQCIETK